MGVVGTARDSAGGADEGAPECRGRMRQPQVDVAVLTERGQELHLGDGDSRVPEQGEPRRKVLGSDTSALNTRPAACARLVAMDESPIRTVTTG